MWRRRNSKNHVRVERVTLRGCVCMWISDDWFRFRRVRQHTASAAECRWTQVQIFCRWGLVIKSQFASYEENKTFNVSSECHHWYEFQCLRSVTWSLAVLLNLFFRCINCRPGRQSRYLQNISRRLDRGLEFIDGRSLGSLVGIVSCPYDCDRSYRKYRWHFEALITVLRTIFVGRRRLYNLVNHLGLALYLLHIMTSSSTAWIEIDLNIFYIAKAVEGQLCYTSKNHSLLIFLTNFKLRGLKKSLLQLIVGWRSKIEIRTLMCIRIAKVFCEKSVGAFSLYRPTAKCLTILVVEWSTSC